jgi:hypothetical protein
VHRGERHCGDERQVRGDADRQASEQHAGARPAVADGEQAERDQRAEEQRVAVAGGAEQRQVPRRQAVGQRVDHRPLRHTWRQERQEEQARGAEQNADQVRRAELDAEATAATERRGDRTGHQEAEAELVAAGGAARPQDRRRRVDDAGAVLVD